MGAHVQRSIRQLAFGAAVAAAIVSGSDACLAKSGAIVIDELRAERETAIAEAVGPLREQVCELRGRLDAVLTLLSGNKGAEITSLSPTLPDDRRQRRRLVSLGY